MNYILIAGLVIVLVAMVVGFRLGWELLQQNGRMLLRMEALEKQIEEKAESGKQKAETDYQDAGADGGDGSSAPTNGHERAERFSNHSLANSKIKRDGLKAGTLAPEFRLPRLDGGELSLSELRGRLVLLVFSSPHCGPCNALAPKLEKFHRKYPRLEIVMISKEEPEANREKVNEHGLTFPVVLQKQWEVSRDYAYFATPVAYLIDSTGVITADVAVGGDAVLALTTRAKQMLGQEARERGLSPLKRLAGWNARVAYASLQKLSLGLGKGMAKLQLFELKHFKLVPRPDDIFIVTYPRSGTTWMQMILYQLTDGNMDIPHIAERCPWFERSVRSAQDFEQRKSPRVFKSHLSFDKIPKGPGRYLYVARDGRDVAVSYYNLYRNYNGYKGAFAEFFEEFMNGKLHYGSWFKHVSGWWKHRNDLNVLFLTYEELQRDLEACIRRIIAFCHLEVPAERLPVILERCSFDFMKQHETKFDPALEVLWEQGTQLNSFLRTGRTGEGARELTAEQQVRFDQAYRVLLEPKGFAWPAQGASIAAAAPVRSGYVGV
jgi:peroxiredoxin